MTAYVALLRAVNVGGTGKLPMTVLTAMCEAEGFESVKTYIASGNVVFRTTRDEAAVKAALESRLLAFAGKPVGVLVRTAGEMIAVLAHNPFPDAAPNRATAIFLDSAPPVDLMDGVTHQRDERIAPGAREIYVTYGSGMDDSKLKIRAAAEGTARNMNTIAKLAEMARVLEESSAP